MGELVYFMTLCSVISMKALSASYYQLVGTRVNAGSPWRSLARFQMLAEPHQVEVCFKRIHGLLKPQASIGMLEPDSNLGQRLDEERPIMHFLD